MNITWCFATFFALFAMVIAEDCPGRFIKWNNDCILYPKRDHICPEGSIFEPHNGYCIILK